MTTTPEPGPIVFEQFSVAQLRLQLAEANTRIAELEAGRTHLEEAAELLRIVMREPAQLPHRHSALSSDRARKWQDADRDRALRAKPSPGARAAAARQRIELEALDREELADVTRELTVARDQLQGKDDALAELRAELADVTRERDEARAALGEWQAWGRTLGIPPLDSDQTMRDQIASKVDSAEFFAQRATSNHAKYRRYCDRFDAASKQLRALTEQHEKLAAWVRGCLATEASKSAGPTHSLAEVRSMERESTLREVLQRLTQQEPARGGEPASRRGVFWPGDDTHQRRNSEPEATVVAEPRQCDCGDSRAEHSDTYPHVCRMQGCQCVAFSVDKQPSPIDGKPIRARRYGGSTTPVAGEPVSPPVTNGGDWREKVVTVGMLCDAARKVGEFPVAVTGPAAMGRLADLLERIAKGGAR